LYDAGIVDELVKELLGGTYTDQQRTAEALKAALL
jgi:acetyl-CoA carboxylase alpha subunit